MQTIWAKARVLVPILLIVVAAVCAIAIKTVNEKQDKMPLVAMLIFSTSALAVTQTWDRWNRKESKDCCE